MSERPRTFADAIRDPEWHRRNQHRSGIHTDCDRSVCDWWTDERYNDEGLTPGGWAKSR